MNKSSCFLALATGWPVLLLAAELPAAPARGQAHLDVDEVIWVRGERNPALHTELQANADAPVINAAELLPELAGTALNANGPLTPIVQYRGLFGDRVHISLEGSSAVGAGPNAMDPALSYVANARMAGITLARGIAPVSEGIDTLGGAVTVQWHRPQFFSGIQGELALKHQSNGQRQSAQGRLAYGGERWAGLVYAEGMQGEDIEDGDNRRIHPTGYDKWVVGTDQRVRLDSGHLGFDYQHLETTDAGTPALPMDIDYIRTDSLNLYGEHHRGDWLLDWQLGYTDARHGMGNDRQRPLMPGAAPRYNTALSDSGQFRVSAIRPQPQGELRLGLNGLHANHDSTITSSTNPMFRVTNFADVQDRRLGLYLEQDRHLGDWQWQWGARAKHYRADAGPVSHHMAGSNPAIATLVAQFNEGQRRVDDWGWDLALKGRYQLGPAWHLIGELGHKQQGPSYQQRYLWIPMQSTGGLADGRTYVGDPDLDLETAYQVELGVDYLTSTLSVAPRLFYHRIDDYIQGIPVTDPIVRQLAMMSGDEAPLQFANTDATLYGADLDLQWQIGSHWQISGNLNLVRGERRDIEDDLYRIAPASARMALHYSRNAWFGSLRGLAVAGQDRVSMTQQEAESQGYGRLDLTLGYRGHHWHWQAGVENLLDRQYADHLSGFNRVAPASLMTPEGSDLALGERIPGAGRSAWASVQYRF